MSRDYALEKALGSFRLYVNALEEVQKERDYFADACREAHEVGVSDRELSELTEGAGRKYSRARIQQFRQGDPQRMVAA